MELTYQQAIQFPEQCCLLTEYEMTYITGGEYTFQVGKYLVTFDPEALGEYVINFAYNFAYLLGAAALSSAITGLVKGYKDGVGIGGTIENYWGNQNTGGRIATVVVGAMAGYYAYVQAVQIYNTVVEIVDTVKAWWAAEHSTSTATTAAAA